jgi:hypothetical protein
MQANHKQNFIMNASHVMIPIFQMDCPSIKRISYSTNITHEILHRQLPEKKKVYHDSNICLSPNLAPKFLK